MFRILLTYIVPLVMPALGWYLWQRYLAQPAGTTPRGWRAAPWHWLAPAGVVLVAAMLGTIAFLDSGRPGDTYRPATVVDGKVVPGRHDPAAPGY